MPRRAQRGDRAPRIGRVTRRSHLIRIRQRGQERPLPFDLQVLPRPLDATPVHPDCHTEGRHWGAYVRMTEDYIFEDYLEGLGLSPEPDTYALVSEGATLGYTGSVLYATAWAAAARQHLSEVHIVATKE